MAEESLSGLGKQALEVVKSTLMPTEVKELLNDRIYFWRFKQMHRILERAAEFIENRKKAGKITPLAPHLAVRFIDLASMEDNADMQELWARLLANASDPNAKIDVTKTHMSILSELSPLDARILAYFPTQGWLQDPHVAASIVNPHVLDCTNIAKDLNEDKTRVAVGIGNLWRLGCLLQEPTWKSGVGASAAEYSAFRPSPLGASLLRAVSDPAK